MYKIKICFLYELVCKNKDCVSRASETLHIVEPEIADYDHRNGSV